MLEKLLSAVIVALSSYLLYLNFNQTSLNLNTTTNYNVTINTAKWLSSSVWCYYDKTNNKICTFRNLCFIPENKNFIFILTNESVISGLKSKNDFKVINLSSVENHNNMFLKLQVVINFYGEFNHDFITIPEPILLIKRFKSDNIMHVIHDDILPIFMTYSHLCAGNVYECIQNNRLMFVDDYGGDSNLEWYNILSNKKPFYLNNLKTLSCFDKMFVGVTRETVWFQYGFGVPQGPVESPTINSFLINKFSDFILNYFLKKTMPKITDEEFINIILFSRRNNRKILNENFVTNIITEEYRRFYPEQNKIIKIHVLDPSQNKSTDILNAVMRSQILIGMHGSAMIYSLFLPKNSAIVELFPFGIQPQHVSSTRAFCQLPGTFYNYLSWRNFKEDNSIQYPERSALLGGIKHLSLPQQETIKKLKTVPAVECCHDPAYLFRMFQDTIVDQSFSIIFKQALFNQKEMIQANTDTFFVEYAKDNWFFPGPISNISCRIDKKIGIVKIEWNEPYNIKSKSFFMKAGLVLYHIKIHIFTRTVTLETFSSMVSVKLTLEESVSVISNDIQFWVKAVIDDTEGVDVHSYCTSHH